MKSQIISKTRGFLIGEIMIAFSLMPLFLTSAIVLSAASSRLHEYAVHKLAELSQIGANISSTTLIHARQYGNDTEESVLDPINFTSSNYETGWGRDTCDPRLAIDLTKYALYKSTFDFGSGNNSTDLEVRNSIIYITTDSTLSSAPDLFILDMHNPIQPQLLSSLNTGPGLSSIEVAGPYLYAANLGTTNQLQIIDISNRAAPILLSRLKLPLPHASSTAPLATTLFYSNGYIYLGTEKWEGDEFAVIDVRNPANPIYLGGFNTDTQINTLYVRDGKAYVADSDEEQLRVLDVSSPTTISQVSHFSPSGWETQQGRALSFFEGILSFGRNTGGFNVVGNHELFYFSSSSSLGGSKDIPGGIYGIIERPAQFILTTHFTNKELRILNKNLVLEQEKALGFMPQALGCDHSTLYFATGDRWGIATLKKN